MFFRLEYVSQWTLLRLTSSEFPIRFDEIGSTKVTLLAPEGDPSPELNRPDAICRVELEKQPDSGVRSMFEGLTRGQLPEDYERSWLRPTGLPDEGPKSTNLSAQVVFMPKPFRDFVDQVLPPMSDVAARVLDLLRWRFDRHAAIFHESADGFKFSFDHEIWYNMPSRVDPFNARSLDSIRGRVFGEEEAAALSKELLSGSAEPLGHALWREAWDLRSRSPRSSLLVGFTAAETGLKRHIVRTLPVTRNLVMAMPSPPIKELIDYVDVLHNTARQTGRRGLIPRSIRKLLIKMGELRNKVTHTGEHDPDGEKLTFDFLDEKLKAVRDLLWLLDFYAGHRWAWEYVSEERRAELTESLVKQRES